MTPGFLSWLSPTYQSCLSKSPKGVQYSTIWCWAANGFRALPLLCLCLGHSSRELTFLTKPLDVLDSLRSGEMDTSPQAHRRYPLLMSPFELVGILCERCLPLTLGNNQLLSESELPLLDSSLPPPPPLPLWFLGWVEGPRVGRASTQDAFKLTIAF